jgi:hypothetical protein
MSEPPALRVSDADRERAVVLLRDHAAAGRLTLEEFTERMSAAYAARTSDDLAALARDLPAQAVPVPSRRRATRLLLAAFGSTERDGRIRVGRRVACVVGFGNIDLDLRRATFERDEVTIFALCLFGAIDVYVPEGIEVDASGLVVFGHKGVRGNDPRPVSGAPFVRVVAFGLFAGIDIWRVPGSWAEKGFGAVIKGIRRGEHRQLVR